MDSVGDRVNAFKDLFLTCVDNHAPIKTLKLKGKSNPSITPEIKERIRTRNERSVILYETLTPGYAMLMSLKQDETAVHGCHSTGTLLRACVKVRPDRGDV